MAARDDFRADINGLRGLAVALVVAYHLQLRGAGGGFIGVDVFFVVSGFLMTRILLADDTPSVARYVAFVAARARRIWPALAVLAVLLLGAGVLALPPFDLEHLARQVLWALGFASNHYYLAHSGYADRAADDLWLLHSWSLSVEWQFYLLYPLLLLALQAVLRRADATAQERRRAALWLLLALAAVSLAWQAAQRGAALESGFFLFASRAWELLAGGVAFLCTRDDASHPLGPRGRRALALLGLALVLGSALALAVWRLRPVGLDLLLLVPVLGTALMLWAADLRSPWLGAAPLQALGRWSYSIYLWHWPIALALRWTPWWQEQRTATVLAAMALSVLAGAASYRWVERPWLGRRGPAHGLRAAVAPTGAMLIGALLASTAWLTHGLAWRDSAPAPAAYEASVRFLLFPDERCGNFKRPIEAMALCSVERGPGRRVLVIGDSHAGHLWPWFARHSRVTVDFLQAAECPPVPGFERLQPGYRCKDYATRAWALALDPAYDTVIVSARWATVGRAGPPYCHEAAAGRCEVVTTSRKESLVRHEIGAAVARSLRAGKSVVVLDSAPEAHVTVPRRLARERFWYGQPRLAIERASVAASNDWLEPLWAQLAGEPGFHRVSLRDRLCDARHCRVYDATLGRPVYYDDSHFDPLWIAENAPFFEPFVQREAPARAPRP